MLFTPGASLTRKSQDGIDDPHVAASLFKLWLRELEEPVVPSVLYNEALACSTSPGECIDFVTRLPTYNRRVLLFAISFFQQFMREEVVELTKMTPPNLGPLSLSYLIRRSGCPADAGFDSINTRTEHLAYNI